LYHVPLALTQWTKPRVRIQWELCESLTLSRHFKGEKNISPQHENKQSFLRRWSLSLINLLSFLSDSRFQVIYKKVIFAGTEFLKLRPTTGFVCAVLSMVPGTTVTDFYFWQRERLPLCKNWKSIQIHYMEKLRSRYN
jgi:hypothetical protein